MILREHLEVLKQYADEMYASNAQETLDSLDPEDLDEIPLEVQEDDTHVCVNYFLPTRKMIRVLPNIGFEVRKWEEVSDGRGSMMRRQEMTWKLVVYRVKPDK
jgi:hypothetical protein